MELSQNKLKYLVSLHQKKYREEHKVFIAEGVKVIRDLVKFGFEPSVVVYDPNTKGVMEVVNLAAHAEVYTMNPVQSGKISTLSAPPGIFAVFSTPLQDFIPDPSLYTSPWYFLLENITDPGNLGTIIRTAHWFGIKDLFITRGSVETYSPKVVQACMGSLAAVKVHIADPAVFKDFLDQHHIPVYITDMEGEPLDSARNGKPACIIMGSEAHGVSDLWRASAKKVITIPPISPAEAPESLNVAVSTAIIMQVLTKS